MKLFEHSVWSVGFRPFFILTVWSGILLSNLIRPRVDAPTNT
jgi:uncharacterized protein involved in response to NO